MSVVVDKRRALLWQAVRSSTAPVAAAPRSAPPEMTIAALRAFRMPAATSGTGYILLEVRTRSGLTGYGECRSMTRADRESTAAAIVGRQASAYEVLAPLVPPVVRAALNMALLDLLGKATGAPVFRILGGPTRNKVRAVARLSGTGDAELKADLNRQIAAGFRAFILPLPAPASQHAGSALIHAAVARLESMRAAVPAADFAIEAHADLSPGDAGALGAALERLHPLWFNEPCTVSNVATLHKIADETVVPLGFGRDIADAGVYQEMLREGVIDLLRLDVLTHGITGTRRLAALAETYYVDVAPWNDGGGPIADAAALHIAASIPNFFIAQMSTHGTAPRPLDGFFSLSNAPGLGVTISRQQIETGVLL